MFTIFELLQAGVDPNDVVVIAKHLPGDMSIDYASPVAGAYFTPDVSDDEQEYARHTYLNLPKLMGYLGSKCGISRVKVETHAAERLTEYMIQVIGEFADEFEVFGSSQRGCIEAFSIKGYNFNPPLLMASMMSKFESDGVTFVRETVSDLRALLRVHSAVFNCSGLGAELLAKDKGVYPTRGQVVVIEAPHVDQVTAVWRGDDATYVIPRPHSKNSEVILGGFYQARVKDANTYGYETADILSRVTEMVPDLLLKNPYGQEIEDLRILRVVAGARPSREGGARVEPEEASGGAIFHNYGAGGCGYLCGLGMANKSVAQWASWSEAH